MDMNMESLSEPAVRTKRNAAANEKDDIKSILQLLTATASPSSFSFLHTAFTEAFPGFTILDARHGGGGTRHTHYDFEIQIHNEATGDTVWKRVEHKGSKLVRKLSPTEVPWKVGVQFHNGGCEKYDFAQFYARIWYDTYIGSGELKTAFSVNADIPSFEDWWTGVCKVQGEPTHPFGIELKNAVKAKRNGGSLLAERARVNALFQNQLAKNPELLKTLQNQVVTVANSTLLQKDYWLAVCGSLASATTKADVSVRWYPAYSLPPVISTEFVKSPDIKIRFTCEDGFQFVAMLRWGYGAGFSNLRVDLK